MKITRRFFITALLSGWVSTFNSKLLGSFSSNSSFTSRNTVLAEQKQNKCNVISKVVSVYSGRATKRDSIVYPYVDLIDSTVVEKMLNKAITELTEEKSAESAWRCLFASYKEGDIISIKPNFNDLHKEFRESIVVSPAVINSILKGLVEFLGVSPRNIIIYDCTSTIPDNYRKRIIYPVRFVEPYGSSFLRKVAYRTIGNPLPKADLDYQIEMTHDIKDKKGNKVKCYLPRVITSADHIINVPVFKSHQFILASGALKNHYGTVRFSDGHLTPENLHPPIIHDSIADINANFIIREKTRLIVMDALFGRLKKKGGPPDKWSIFNNENPNRLFLSRDPVALDSVSAFFIRKELQAKNDTYLPDDYLKIASYKKIGIYEIPGQSGEFKSICFRYYEV
jgi:uncharacterized protein (DUF362 family)